MKTNWTDLIKTIFQEGASQQKPVSGMFELTSRCNFRCKMCYICMQGDNLGIQGKELTTEQWIRMGEEARDAGLFFLTLTGGEIFLRSDFFEIYEALMNMGLFITLYTNGSLIKPKDAERLAKNPPRKVSITIYGANLETYGLVTGHPEGYLATMNGIKALQEAGINLELKMTVIKQNVHEFDTLVDYALSMGKQMGIVNYVFPRREGEGYDPHYVRQSPEALALFDQRFKAKNKAHSDILMAEKHDIVASSDIMQDESILHTLSFNATPDIKRNAFYCSAGKCGFWLTWDGRMIPCGTLGDLSTNPLKLGFENAWYELVELCNEVPLCDICEICVNRSKCDACPARLKAETGAFDKPAPYLCEYAIARNKLSTQ